MIDRGDRCRVTATLRPGLQPGHDLFNLFDIFLDARRLHLAEPDALLGGVHEILAVPKDGDDRNPQGVEEAHELCKALGVLARAIGHDGELAIAAIDFQLNDPSVQMTEEETELFWRERVRLMKSLVQLRYAQAQRTSF